MGERVSIPISFEKGLLEFTEDSMTPEGFATKMENWTPEPQGNLRARNGWSIGSTTSAPATRKGRGIGRFASITSYQTPTQVQKVSSTNTAPTWPAATTAGNQLIAIMTWGNGTGNTTPPSGWTKANETAVSTRGVAIFYIDNAASRSGTESFSTSGTGDEFFVLLEYSGVQGFDLTASTTGTSTTASSGTTGTTNQVSELAVVGIATSSNVDHSSPTNSYTQIYELNTANARGSSYEKNLSAKAATSMDVTLASSTGWAGVIATFKAKAVTSSSSTGFYLAAQDDSTGHKVYVIPGNDVAAGTWTLADTVTNSGSNRYVSYAPGLQNVFYTSPYFATLRRYDGGSGAAVTDGPAGRCVAFHKNRVFVGGSADNPSRLSYSALSDYTDWTTANAAGNFEIREDDGDAIEDIEPVQDGLLIAKENSLHFLHGSGPDDFTRVQVDGGGGAPGKCICPTPYGAIVAGVKQVWLWAGGSPELISKPIEDSYEITGDFVTTAYIDGIAYILDEGTGIAYCINLITGTWHLEKFSSANEAPAVIFAHKDKLLSSPLTATTYSLLNYRMVPSTKARDASVSQTFTAWTGELWPLGPEQKMTPRYLHLKLRQHAGDATGSDLSVTPLYDGTAITARTVAAVAGAPKSFRARVDIADNASGKGVSSVMLKFTKTCTSSDASIMDIEEATLEFDREPMYR